MRCLPLLLACALASLAASGLAQRAMYLSPAQPAVVRIEAGWFEMGSDDAEVLEAVRLCDESTTGGSHCSPALFADEQPRRRVFVSAYRIDRSEVDNAGYRRCMAAGVCAPPRTSAEDARLGRDEHPVAGVRWDEAVRYCAWVGGRLPTEAEWERAARGSSRRAFPWGDHFNSRVANHGRLDGSPELHDGHAFAAPVKAYADGHSPYGLLNMAGNVAEWVADRYAPRGYEDAARVDPRGPESGDERVVRGGSWRSPPFVLRVASRAKLADADTRPDVGFRCAYNVARPPRKTAAASGSEAE